MDNRISDKIWLPVWVDKWLWGSTRHELIYSDPAGNVYDLRGIFIDLLTMAAKDAGYIRANPYTPYPMAQLAGMFCVPQWQLEKCIELCLQPPPPGSDDLPKLIKHENGTLQVAKWEKYQFSERYHRLVVQRAAQADAAAATDPSQEPVPKSGNAVPHDGTALPHSTSNQSKEQIKDEKNQSMNAPPAADAVGVPAGPAGGEPIEPEVVRPRAGRKAVGLLDKSEALAVVMGDATREQLEAMPMKKRIVFSYKKRRFYGVLPTDIDLWRKAYPACDIATELHRMGSWLLQDERNAKINYAQFINGWLRRSQQNGGTRATGGRRFGAQQVPDTRSWADRQKGGVR